MVGGEDMSGILAIGIGCRRNCSSATLAQLVSRTLAMWPKDLPMPPARSLFTVEDKHDETGIRELATTLGIDLVFLPREALRQAMPRTLTHSARAEKLFGLASVAEASALAGGGPNAALIVPRISDDNATCAVAADLSAPGDHRP
jgi:cobalt-precorrin 5A hydrolase